MSEWFSTPIAEFKDATVLQLVAVLLLRLSLAAVYGGCVALAYRYSHGRMKDDAAVLTATLVLLAVLIAMVSMVIGDSVARAFSLVGALSIVRFRTVVDDTRDTAFVIFAVIVGMAAGAGALWLPLVGIPIVAAIAIGLSRTGTFSMPASTSEGSLTIRLGLGREPNEILNAIFDKYLRSYRVVNVETTRQGAALDLKYRIQMRTNDSTAPLVTELNKIEGVQNVELRLE